MVNLTSRLALAGLAAIFVVGAWLIAAPFVLRFQPSGASWTGAARMDVTVGAALVLAGFSGFFTALAGRVRELYAEADRRTSAESGGVESLVRDL
jgi:hypothetical protein